MATDRPTVTVIVPVYNAAKYLPCALDSLLSQTFTDFEIITVDDGSTDDSGAILRQYAARDPRIRVLSQENRGHAAARKKATEIARGRYIAQQDADDASAPSRLGKQAEFLDAHPDVCAVYCDTTVADEGLNKVRDIENPRDDGAIRRALPKGNTLQPNHMVRAEVWRRLGGYRTAFRYAGDYDFNLRLSELGKIACLPDALYIYRTHSAQISTKSLAEQDKYAALARAFAMERSRTGRDSYDSFAASGDLQKFVGGYALRYQFNLFAGEMKLRRLDVADARTYLRAAVKHNALPLRALALLAGSYVPRGVLQIIRLLKNRFVDKASRMSHVPLIWLV